MNFWKSFRSTFKNIYSLPTWRGAFLLLCIGAAFWYSIDRGSELERWLGLLMTVFTLLHLLESSFPLRTLEVQFATPDLPFAGQPISLPIRMGQPGKIDLQNLLLNLEKSKPQLEIPSLSAEQHQDILIPFEFKSPGIQPLPRLRVQMVTPSGLFFYWLRFNPEKAIQVLPPPVNHLKSISKHQNQYRIRSDDYELRELELITDPRFLIEKDEKLFLKTGLPYRKKYASSTPDIRLTLDWRLLTDLPDHAQSEQFSYWLQELELNYRDPKLKLDVIAPFFNGSFSNEKLAREQLKVLFARWLYE